MRRQQPIYPDERVYPEDSFPYVWDVSLELNGNVLDQTSATITAAIFNDGVSLGNLDLDLEAADLGVVRLVLDEELYAKLGYYNTWQLRSDMFPNVILCSGRLIKQR